MIDQLSLEGKPHQSGVNCEKFRRNSVFPGTWYAGDDLFSYSPVFTRARVLIKPKDSLAPYLDVNG